MDSEFTQNHEDNLLEDDYYFETLETLQAKQNLIQDSRESFPRDDLEYLSKTPFFSNYNISRNKWLNRGIPKDLGLKNMGNICTECGSLNFSFAGLYKLK